MKKVIGIDIGATKTIGAIINQQGKILKEIRIDTNASLGPENLMNSISSIIEQLLKVEKKISAIGIGAAGSIDTETGKVFFASDNLPGWMGQDIKQPIEAQFNIPTFVDNDCNVAGLGEQWLGSARKAPSYVSLSLGTGVGAAVFVNGQLLHGAHHSGAELGHMIIHPNGRPCNCGLKGCLEQYCSGPSLVKAYQQISQKELADGYAFFEQVKQGDLFAKHVLEEFVNNLATACLSLFNIYDPELIVLSGGLIDTRDLWWSDFMDIISKSKLNDLFKLVVYPAQLGSKAALYGAAYLAFQNRDTFGKRV